MVRTAFLFLVFFSLFSGTTACKKNTPVPVPELFSGQRYVPMSKGSYVVYRADSLVWNDFTGSVDTFRFYIKEKVASVVTDSGGQSTFFQIESYRAANRDSFSVPRVWSAVMDKQRFVKTTENISCVKLSFPLQKGKSWNGNATNTLGEQSYSCMQLHTPFSAGSLVFDSTACILQKADSNLISLALTRERYSTRCGLCYFQDIALEDTRSSLDISKPLRARANKGHIFTVTAILFGTE